MTPSRTDRFSQSTSTGIDQAAMPSLASICGSTASELMLARKPRRSPIGEAEVRAVTAWGLETQCLEPKGYSSVLTAVRTPDGHDADKLRALILERFDMSLGAGLGKIQGKVFRIGHIGDFNDLTLAGTLCGVEMGLDLAGVPFQKGGVDAALRYLGETSRS